MGEALETKEKILESARVLFEENSYHEISMSAIAGEAGIGKGTLYWHFSSKDELFNEMICREGSKVLLEMKTLHQENIPAQEALKMFIRGGVIGIKDKKKIARIFMHNDIKFRNKFRDSLFKTFSAIINELENIINRGVESGVFVTGSPRKTAFAILGMIHTLTINMMTEEMFGEERFIEKRFDEDKLIEFIYNLILGGIANRKGMSISE